MKRKVTDKKKKVTVPGSYLSDASVIHHILASKQAEKFKTLWEGEIPEGKSHSEADMTLVQILAFWCGGDKEQIDRLFRQSGLMRDKWDEKRGSDTYGAITIENVIANCLEFYSPTGMSLAELDFNDLVTCLEDAEHYSTCMQTYLLLEYGEVRNESENTAVLNGAFGYKCYDECVHAYQF